MPRLMNLREASEYSGVSIWTLRKRASERKIPIVKIGTSVYIEVEELDRWIDAHKIHPLEIRKRAQG